MKNDIVMTSNFWSGVINYVRASAQSAEALKPWDFREEKEALTVLVFKTTVNSLEEQALLSKGLTELLGDNNWTIDLDDVDKVLRVVGFPSKETSIMHLLKNHNFKCEVLN